MIVDCLDENLAESSSLPVISFDNGTVNNKIIECPILLELNNQTVKTLDDLTEIELSETSDGNQLTLESALTRKKLYLSVS